MNAFREQLVRYRTPLLLIGAATVIALVVWRLLPSRELGVTIGMEGRYEVVVAGEQLHAVPYTHGDTLAVRIVSATETKNGVLYDLRYMPYGPGEHDISEYLLRADGPTDAALPPMMVTVDPLLAEDESGELFNAPQAVIDLHSNYPLVMALLWGVWGLLLIPLLLYGRKPRQRVVVEPPPPSTAERLRVLLQTAENQSLDAAQQADLETLLLRYWTERTGADRGSLVETLEQLRAHPLAGRHVQAVEQWLHRRDASANGSVARELLSDLGWSRDSKRRGRA
jgi:hypothetical protein